MQRKIFLISDRTGITIEGMAEAVMSQFASEDYNFRLMPFIDSDSKLQSAIEIINSSVDEDELPPIVFSSLVSTEFRQELKKTKALNIDLFERFLTPIEKYMGCHRIQTTGQTHGLNDVHHYDQKQEAINFTINHDDGLLPEQLDRADIILIGVSRSGKTPSCLYLALNYGIRAANYPLIEDDMIRLGLPESLKKNKAKLFGLRISAERLHNIREARRPNSHYASLAQCRKEAKWVDQLYKTEKIPHIATTTMSVEEIAANIRSQLLEKSPLCY